MVSISISIHVTYVQPLLSRRRYQVDVILTLDFYMIKITLRLEITNWLYGHHYFSNVYDFILRIAQFEL